MRNLAVRHGRVGLPQHRAALGARGTSARSALVAGFNDIGATFVAHADGAARRNFNPLLDEGRQVAASLFETSDA